MDPAEHAYVSQRFLQSEAILRTGNFANGFAEYEWRLKVPGTAGGIPPDDWPRWFGLPMPQGRVLIFCDQGRGDIIQFARYIPWVADRCPDLAVCCPGEMWPILRQFPRVRTLVQHWYEAGDCAAYVPIGSLPFVAGTRLDTIPTPIPYLRSNPELAAAWRARLDPLFPAGMRRVGLVWAGNPTHYNDRNRSIALSALHPLTNVPGVGIVSLQLGEARAQFDGFVPGGPFVDAAPEIRGFDDTMAILEGLDLTIAVDTSIVHLAGAMGRPAWVLLPHLADWRWLEGLDASPWYPSLRLFRQPEPGAWAPVIEHVAAELQQASR